MEEVLIIGGKGTAINLAEQIEDARQRFDYPMRVIGFAIDDTSRGSNIAGFPVLCSTQNMSERFRNDNVKFFFALYRPDQMRERVALLQSYDIAPSRFANFIHPLAYVAPSAQLGFGNAIFSHACIQHGVRLGNHNVVNAHVVIEHETQLQNSVFVAASACVGARANLGTGTFIGLNSTVREDITIADYAFVGMGSAVVHSVGEGVMVYGVPARPKK